MRKYVEQNTNMSIHGVPKTFKEVNKMMNSDLYEVFQSIARGIYKDQYKELRFGYQKWFLCIPVSRY